MSRYRQTMSELLEQVRAPKENIDNDYLKPRMTPQQIANIKKTWQNKKASDVTPAIKKMIKDMDIPTQMAIKQANIPHISKLVEEDDHEISMARGELEAVADKALKLSAMLQGKSDDDQLEAWVQSKITKAKDYINSVVDYMTYNPDFATEHMIEAFSDQQIAKLKKEYEPLRGARISVTNANKLGAMFTKFDSNKNALEKLYGGNIPFISQMAMSRLISKHGYTADKIKKIKVAEEVEVLEEGTGTIKGFRNDKEKSNMISLAKQHSLKVKEVSGGIELSGNMRKILDMQLAAQGNGLKAEEYINEGRMSEIDAMRKAGATAADIAKELKLSVKVVKSILGEEVEYPHKMYDPKTGNEVEAKTPEDHDKYAKMGYTHEKPKQEETKEDDKEKLKAELEKKDDEIAMLKTKAETEKAKTMKKETEKLVNPETGEPLLQVGVAYKHIRDKMQKEETIIEFTSQQIKMAYGILNDPRYKQGNYTGAVKAIEKLAKGLSKHPDVANALKRANESLDEMAKDKAYAIGMATAKKKYNDEPPLEKKTIKKGHEIADKLMGMKKEETIKEFKKMTVTFPTMDRMAKASTDLAKHGFTIHAKGLVMKVDGKGDDLNKYATDLKNFYGATVKAEGTMIGGIVTDNSGKKLPGYDKAKKALKDFMSKPQPAKGADNKVMAFIFDDELLDDLYVASKKNMSDVRPLVKKRLKALGIKENAPTLTDLERLKKQGLKPKKEETQHNLAKMKYEQIAGLKKKAEKSGMPYSILKKVYDRGMAAWRGGHRPGTTQQQWAFARVNSFVTKSSGTWGGADKDLAKQVRGK